MRTHLRRVGLALTAALLTTTSLGAGSVHADEGGLDLVGAGLITDRWGGFPSLSWGFQGIGARISDATVTRGHVYVATATDTVTGEQVSSQPWEPPKGWDGADAVVDILPGPGVVFGQTYDVVVAELDRETVVEESAPDRVTYEAVEHPESLTLHRTTKTTVKAGSLLRFDWKGAYGDDVASVTQIVAARGASGFRDRRSDFLICKNSYCPTKGQIRFVRTASKELETRIRVPERLAGKTLVIAVYGSPKRDRASGLSVASPWGWTYELKITR